MRITLLALAMFATAGAASAQASFSISLKAGTLDSVESQTYACEGAEPFSVQYVNSGANALAIVPLDGEDLIFVNVLSASGAKYVSGAHVWWTKGNTAIWENELEDGSTKECTLQVSPPSK